MTLQQAATEEINLRWPEHRQRNVGISYGWYGTDYADKMTIGIQLIRDRYHELKAAGATTWSISEELRQTLDDLAGSEVTTSLSPAP